MANTALDVHTSRPVRLSFSDPSEWMFSESDFFRGATVKIGDPVSGSTAIFFASTPGAFPANYPAHGHASDSFRITVRGNAPTGEFDYLPGEFRLQEGWKPYGADNLARGADAGWQFLMFADRRGARARPVKPDDVLGGGEGSSGFLGVVRGDVFAQGDERFEEPGPTGLVATLAKAGSKHSWVNGSFEDTEGWISTSAGSKVAAALLGHPVSGPLLLLVSAAPGSSVSFGSAPLGTEVMHVIVSGTGSIDGDELSDGDIYVAPGDVPCPALAAGSGGVQEVVVFGDRRAAATVDGTSGEFAALLEPLVRELEGKLAAAA